MTCSWLHGVALQTVSVKDSIESIRWFFQFSSSHTRRYRFLSNFLPVLTPQDLYIIFISPFLPFTPCYTLLLPFIYIILPLKNLSVKETDRNSPWFTIYGSTDVRFFFLDWSPSSFYQVLSRAGKILSKFSLSFSVLYLIRTLSYNCFHPAEEFRIIFGILWPIFFELLTATTLENIYSSLR